MSVTVKGKTIIMTHGDTIKLAVNIVNKNGSVYKPAQGDSIRFALKKDYEDEEAIIEAVIPNDTLLLRVESSETKKLDQNGEYVFDVELTTEDGTVDTFIPNGRLIVTPEVL